MVNYKLKTKPFCAGKLYYLFVENISSFDECHTGSDVCLNVVHISS